LKWIESFLFIPSPAPAFKWRPAQQHVCSRHSHDVQRCGRCQARNTTHNSAHAHLRQTHRVTWEEKIEPNKGSDFVQKQLGVGAPLRRCQATATKPTPSKDLHL
jgi:hypothetical protein